MHKGPPPPRGFHSWLDYAVETMDSRSVELQELFNEESASWSREEMLAAAREELEELRKMAAATVTPKVL